MLKSNALEIIKSLTKPEIAEFSDFLFSPFFNKKTTVIKLFTETMKYAPDFTDNSLEKETLWSKIYPNKEFNYGVMKNLIHDLTKLAEEYITQKEYALRELQQFENLFASLSKRNLRNVYLKKELSLKKNFKDDYADFTNRTFDEFYGSLTKIYEIKLWDSSFNDQQKYLNEDIYCLTDSFVTGILVHLINVYYLTEVSSYNDRGKEIADNPAGIILKSISEETFQNIIREVSNRSEFKSRVIKGYFLAHKANANLNESKHFFEFKNYFLNNYQNMPYNYMKDMDTYLLNVLSSLRDPSVDKKSEFYSYHNFRHANNLVPERNNQLNSMQFIPWMFLFLDENKPDELEEYIKSYKDYIVDDDRAATHIFAEAMSLFLKSEFSKSLSLVNKIKFKSAMPKNILKKFSLMIFYELKDFEGFNFAYDSYKHFLSYGNWAKKDWLEHYIEKTKIFAGVIHTLFKLWESEDRTRILAYENELVNLNIDNKKWFLRKINELKN